MRTVVIFGLCFGYYLLAAYSKVPIFSLLSFWSKKLLLFYPHSVRSYLLKASVQSVLNHSSHICLFVLESCLSIGIWCHLQNGALQNAELLS